MVSRKSAVSCVWQCGVAVVCAWLGACEVNGDSKVELESDLAWISSAIFAASAILPAVDPLPATGARTPTI